MTFSPEISAFARCLSTQIERTNTCNTFLMNTLMTACLPTHDLTPVNAFTSLNDAMRSRSHHYDATESLDYNVAVFVEYMHDTVNAMLDTTTVKYQSTAFDLLMYRDYSSVETPSAFHELLHMIDTVNRTVSYDDRTEHIYNALAVNTPNDLLSFSFTDTRLINVYTSLYMNRNSLFDLFVADITTFYASFTDDDLNAVDAPLHLSHYSDIMLHDNLRDVFDFSLKCDLTLNDDTIPLIIESYTAYTLALDLM